MFAKRKARKIQVSEENEEPTQAASAQEEPMNDAPISNQTSLKFTRRPLKSSSLRKIVNLNDDVDKGGPIPTSAAADDDDDEGPAVIRPAVSRSGSTKSKKKATSSKLSFGATEDSGAGAGAEDTQPFTPKKTASLTQRATENNALRSSLSSRKLPTRSFGPEQEATSYSREYLEELQSSTPNTPQNIASLRIHDGDGDGDGDAAGPAVDTDAMDLDPSELEGAVVVPQADLSVSTFGAAGHILSATEIREKKERRARLAKEGDAYEEDDEDGNYISLSSKKKEKESTRLIAEDEDLGEGYDDFVEDARLELGKRGEKEARRRQRREMEELINAAEAVSEDEGEDSDAERKAAYEAAQTRAAMGVRFDNGGNDGKAAGTGLVIPRMKALPELGESLARMRGLVEGMEAQVAAKRKRIENLEKEKQEILEEEKKVQEVLNQEGLKYQAALGINKEDVDPLKLAAESPLRTSSIPSAGRGLESFGTTPLLLADTKQHSNATRDHSHEDDGRGSNEPERRANINLLAISTTPVDTLALLLLGVLLGAQAVAHEALLVALLSVLARNGKLIQTFSMTSAVVGGCDTRAVGAETSQVHLVGGDARVVGEIDASTGRGGGDLVYHGVGEGRLLEDSAAEVGGGFGGPVGVF
ncbi:hypothetical protein VP1G_04713 [Cytospora mali]|uniref:Uncharacterized protein n=1 Tax=Cytospora mali TaxID=578113 RepID=A0A194V0C4_CYTMA|nr:hypothetical protein VP1G_04713 [Valsa mali var. pyri (nom. inval.)]